ncbi:MAG: hypothetical protein RLZZ621_1530 [Gemmatimonadota bacterium]
MASGISTASYPRQFRGDERVRGRFGNRNHQPGEGITRWHEAALIPPLGCRVDTSRPGTPPQHAIDLGDGIVADPVRLIPLLGEDAQGRTHASGVYQGGRRRGRLQHGTAAHAGGPFVIHGTVGVQPRQECLEVPQQIASRCLGRGIGIHEVEPEPGARRHRPGRSITGHGPPDVGGGSGHQEEAGATATTMAFAQTPQSITCLRVCKQAPRGFRAFLPVPLYPTMTSFLFERVVVGSTNPVKIAAVRAVILRMAPEAQIIGVAVPSGVPDQPFGDAETQHGARVRAHGALATGASLGIGLEGGVVRQPDGSLRSCAWAVVVDGTGREGMGGSLSMPLPSAVAARVLAGEELGHAMDAVAQVVGTKHGQGAVGILTAGLVDRQRAYEPMIAYALAPWLAPALYAAEAG